MPASKQSQAGSNPRRTAAALLALLAGVSAAQAAPRHICGAYNSGEKTIMLQVRSGCVSGSHRYQNHTIKPHIDEATATITVAGKFNYERSKSKVITRDCSSGRAIDFTLEGVEPRRYSVVTDKGFAGTLDFTASFKRQCARLTRMPHVMSTRRVAALLPRVKGDTIQEIIAPLMRQLAVSTEGRGSLSVQIGSSGPRPGNVLAGAYAEIKALGLADEAVMGVHFTINFRASGDGWKAMRIGRRNLCARGERAGQWVNGTCA